MMIDFERAFEAIAEAMVQSVKQCSVAAASSEAERHGLIEQGDGTPSQTTIWQRTDQDLTLWLRWHWYDKSKPFSIQPDMNVLSLELLQDGKVLRRAEERYED
jgi:uncharacterized protein YcfL